MFKITTPPSVDYVRYDYGVKFRVTNDVITLSKSKRRSKEDSSDEELDALSSGHSDAPVTLLMMEQISASFALAQSAKLSVYETIVEKVVDANKDIPMELADKGKISITLTDISKRVGQLFMVRMEVNLQCPVTTTPEFFWEEDRNVREYILISKYMEIEKRTAHLKNQLGLIGELYEVIQNEQQCRHESRLEWIIIFLIVLECSLELAAICVPFITDYIKDEL